MHPTCPSHTQIHRPNGDHARLIRLHQGFTLVELLVVVTLVGVMAGAAMLSVGGQQARQLKQETVRLQQLLNQARDESELTQRTLGIIFGEQGYQFSEWQLRQQQWQPITARPYQPYEFALPITLRLTPSKADGRTQDSNIYSAGHVSSADDFKAEKVPDLIFSSSGDHSAFDISLSLESLQQQLSSDGYNPVAFTR